MEVDKIKSWIYTASKNHLIDKKRREQNYKNILEKNFLYDESFNLFNSDEFTNIDNQTTITTAISNLSQIYSDVITLKYFSGLNSTEISQTLDIPASTVRSRLQTAVNMLKKELE